MVESAETKSIRRVMPNKKEYDDKIALINDDVAEMKKKKDDLEKKISNKAVGKDEFLRKRDEMRGKLDAASKAINELATKKEALSGKMKEETDKSRKMRTEINDMQKKLGYQDEEQVDQEISELEYRMHTETLTLKKEKELMQKIAQLRATKPQIAKMKSMKNASASFNPDCVFAPLKAQQNELKFKIDEARAEKRKNQAELAKLLETRKKATDGMSDLYDDRKKLGDEIRAKIDEIKVIREEKNGKMREYIEYVKSQKAVRAERDAQIKAAKEAEDVRRKLQDELDSEDVLPFCEELDLLENTVKYCKDLTPDSEEKAESNATGLKEEAIKACGSGETVLLNKKDREIEFFFKPTGGKKKKDKKKDKGDGVLKHGLQTLKLFESMKISPPATFKDLPECVTALENKIEEVKKQQVEELSNRKANRSDKEKQLEEATKKAKEASDAADSAYKKALAADNM